MVSERDDELARTATAPVSGAASPAPADPAGTTIGRYRLEREIGSGGMGVVHAAWDPDLERRIALKVLRDVSGSSEARKRLLNEARAMARLQHPNVVYVHEVASANGRDFVAMELVEGQTLAEWIRAQSRPVDDIIAAFIAAGRGLAAAHAEGIVHRDFKPHNVLRARNGRIAVTDFGLAREAEIMIDPMAETRQLPVVASASVETSTPSSPLGGLTITGSVLGTPAYMAPEQWSGGAVTHATDQFAFCVALWEALAGERPFKGPTVETLRDAVSRGPARLDTSKIPRRLRPALLRGLDPDPKRRWPSMDALLAAMTATQRSPMFVWVAGAATGAAALAVGVVFALADDEARPAAAPACRASLLAADTVWPADARAKLSAAGQRPAAEMIDADVRAWRAAREQACALAPDAREPHLQCLDGVLARLDAVVRGLEPIGTQGHVDVGGWLVDPAVCTRDTPPRLSTTVTPQLRATIAALFVEEATPGKPTPERARQLIEGAQGDPCASVYGHFPAILSATPTERERLVAEATEHAERCDDDRVRAEIALMGAELALESSMLGATITSKVKLAEVATQKVTQADVLAVLDNLRAEIARRANQLDEAIVRMESAMKRYAQRGRVAAELGAGLRLVDYRLKRATLEDLAGVTQTLDALRARAVEKLGTDHDLLREIDRAIANWEFANGDVDGAMRRLAASYKPVPNEHPRRITGKVVDARGAPVAGARVVADKRLAGTTAIAAASWSDSMRVATTRDDGTFEIPDAVEFGAVVAQHGDTRSRPTAIDDTVTLRLEPTSTLRGRIDLRGEPAQSVTVVAVDPDQPDLRFGWAAPVARDGSFELGGVPRRKLLVFTAIEGTTSRTGTAVPVNVRGPVVEGITAGVPTSRRNVHVIVRSTVNVPVGNAAVLVMPGKYPSMSARQLRQRMAGTHEALARQLEGERAPAPVVKAARSGDVFATMEAPDGAATACAIALPSDLADPTLSKKIDGNLDKLMIECTPIPDQAEVVVIEVPPFPRLD